MCGRQVGGDLFRQGGQPDFQILRLTGPLDLDSDLGLWFVIGQHLQRSGQVRQRRTGQRQQAITGLNSGFRRGAAGIDVAYRDALLGIGAAQGQQAQERMLVGFEFVGQLERHLELLVASLGNQRKLVPGIVAADDVPQLGLPHDLFAVRLDDHIAGLETRGVGGRFGLDRGHFGGQRVDIGAFQVQAQDAGLQFLAAFQFVQVRQDIDQRHGESDARIVPFGSGHLVLALRGQRNQHAQHTAADIDQRTAVVVGRDLGVGLDGLAPDAVAGAQHAHRQVRIGAFERASHGDRPLADHHLAARHHRRDGQFLVGVDFQQHQHPRAVASDDLGRGSLAAGRGDQNRGRLLDEVERAGDDVTVFRHQPVRSSGRCRPARGQRVRVRRAFRSGPPTGPLPRLQPSSRFLLQTDVVLGRRGGGGQQDR
jgi:hypothetical protein